MIRYIDFEYRNLSANDLRLAWRLAGRRERTRYRFEKMAQDTCLVVCYDRFNESLFTELIPKAIVCSRNTVHREYDTDDMMGVEWLLKALPVSLFTICGSYHWMLKLRGTEIGPFPSKSGAGGVSLMELYIHKKGFCPVSISCGQSLFEGIPPEEFPEEHAHGRLLVETFFDQCIYD